MSPSSPRPVPALVWPPAPIPDELDREDLLDRVHDALALRIRADLFPASLPAIAAVRIEVFRGR